MRRDAPLSLLVTLRGNHLLLGIFFFFLQHPEGLMGKFDTISVPISSSANSLWLAAAPVIFLGQSLLSAWKGLKHFRTFLGFLC